ncbi:preprotein translocase subunit SecA [Candidatus Campbellbacteria bacterium CG11_big_fil_rev_8_21_14_0_20_44_21]|uniref:Protein translocase subunit SecA n=1 Tax=Candidatus Campbellbacteria bacterium CG22_combo_CG10-13_8_21_14_all_43_18 TaxID=1974530 RepID=A0A2H0DWV1_9BACT|nr:MAG: preprotein translocase subunit SecA [Candidatus Campbellbacteria bacterium CG22_combo_CG10-13_8_21_14_all_43_18]PIR24040.1 MAG: preprotein translocase subunit SecA [Candidatus Campbellbacteria bacterium CG11_big_fil_rev_8_21_14_0_20_44_21]
MKLLKNLFGDESAKEVKKLQSVVDAVNSFDKEISSLSDSALRDKTLFFKEELKKGKSLGDILPEAYAVVREASKRMTGLRHFDVQIIGGIILHQGKITEMRTGEGKTLAATLPSYLNALSGKGVHVVTVNDYLSRRDAAWMGQIYSFLGLSVGVINHEESFLYDPEHKEADKERDEVGSFKVFHEFLRPCARGEAYAADITYGTNNEFGFDYLRDNIEYVASGLRQRGYHYAIIDEIDSILIDEARTPLIISAPWQSSEDLYGKFALISARLKEEEDYEVDEKARAITLKDSGIEKAERILGVENIYTEGGIKYVHHLETAVRAKALFKKDRDYVIKDGEIIIVDQFTGRLQPGRRWSEGLHQAIEAKEGVSVQKESRTFASITFQNYFRMYGKLSGMTGTARTSAEEFYKVYGLGTVSVPTNKPVLRRDREDLIFQTEIGKFKAISEKIKELNQKGQPVLVGTVSVEKSELLSDFLNRNGVGHTVLNAKKHESEGEVIAQAGKKGSVTIATNMAGRGVDIRLGGNPSTKEESEKVKALGGLFVLGTERHEARRIDDQLRGRSGRQGDLGESQFFVSLEDSLMKIFASDIIKKMMGRFGIPEDQPIENRLITRSLESAQTKIEGLNFDRRKTTLQFDDVLNEQRRSIYKKRREILLGDENVLDKYLSEIFLSADGAGVSASGEEVLKEKKDILGREDFYATIRRMFLQAIDSLWVDHLEMMDYLRGSVNLRAYGQRDPLVEYKKEGLRLFQEMEASWAENVLSLIPGIGAGAFQRERQRLQEIHKEAQRVGRDGKNGGFSRPAKLRAEENIGRNEPCPCGALNPHTNKPYKYKHCGLINAPHHKS